MDAVERLTAPLAEARSCKELAEGLFEGLVAGRIPEEFADVHLMASTGWSYNELLRTPADVVERMATYLSVRAAYETGRRDGSRGQRRWAITGPRKRGSVCARALRDYAGRRRAMVPPRPAGDGGRARAGSVGAAAPGEAAARRPAGAPGAAQYDERGLRALAKEIKALISEDGRRGIRV